MARLGHSSQARHLAVPIEPCDRSAEMEVVASWAEPASFNNVPVTQDGVVIGVVENLLGEYSGLPASPRTGKARNAMRALAGDMLVDASEPIARLPAMLLDPPHYRLVLDRGRISHIVTPSDLGKLPMRVFLFGKVALLEQSLMDAIRRGFPDDESAVATLGPDAQAQVLASLGALHKKNLNPSLLEVTNLPQKALILSRRGGLQGSEAEVAEDFRPLYEDFRNPIVHAGALVNDSLDALRGLRALINSARTRTHEAESFAP